MTKIKLTDRVTLVAYTTPDGEVWASVETDDDLMAHCRVEDFGASVETMRYLLASKMAVMAEALQALSKISRDNELARKGREPGTATIQIPPAPPLEAVYTSGSRGDTLICDMAYPHLMNALAKLVRMGDGHSTQANMLRMAIRHRDYLHEQSQAGGA